MDTMSILCTHQRFICMTIELQSQTLFVGPGWAIYAGPGGYEHSEMVAPALLMAEPGKHLKCCVQGSGALQANRVAHAANVWSDAQADHLIIVYFDALTTAGRMVQLCAEQINASGTLKCQPKINLSDFNDLITGRMPAREASLYYQSQVRELASFQLLESLDPRVISVAHALTEDPAGRLSLNDLAKKNNTSPERLRHLFKKQTGLTLSKYKAWKQVHAMMRRIVSYNDGHYNWKASSTIRSAGFYDDAHGYRTLNQYFGARESLTRLRLKLVDCINC